MSSDETTSCISMLIKCIQSSSICFVNKEVIFPHKDDKKQSKSDNKNIEDCCKRKKLKFKNLPRKRHDNLIDLPGVGCVLMCRLSKAGITNPRIFRRIAGSMNRPRFYRWMFLEFRANQLQSKRIYDYFRFKSKQL